MILRSNLTVLFAFSLVCIWCFGCGTSPNIPLVSTDVLTLSEARQQIGMLDPPPGSVASEFAELRSALETELVAGSETRWVSSAPTDAANQVATLYLTKIDDTTASAQWSYRNVGDYDQNSQVNISDLSALGANLGGAAVAVDGDSNGLVTIADITPLGSHLLNTVDQYAVQATTTPAVEATWLEIERVGFAASQVPNGGGLRTFSLVLPASPGQSFRVVPLSAGSPGIGGLPFLYTGQTGPPPLSYEERTVTLDLISAKLDNLEASTSAEQDQELADYIATLPHIEAAGFLEGNAWGRFTDGRLAIVCKNRAPQGSQASRVPPRAASGFGVPADDVISLLNAFGPGDTYSTPIPGLVPILNDNGYDAWDRKADYLGLNMSNNGGFYIDSHGGTGVSRDGSSQYCVWTDEAYTAANETLFAADLSAGRMAYMLAMDAAGSNVWKYCFSDEFVLEYMSFSDNSVVFINACKSGTAQDMIDAFHFVGATVYLGWTINVPDSVANKAAEHFFDRVLGANQLGRDETPPVRPFEYYWVMADMVARGVSAGEPVKFPDPPGEPYSHLLYLLDDDDPSTGFTLLAPTIQNMVMFDNANELRINGHFGDLQGTVTVGGQAVQIDLWDGYEIRCTLPVTGPGSAGDVVVDVLGHKSNPRRLTEWRGDINWVATGPGNLTRSTVFEVHFRGDLNNWRQFPATDPLYEGSFTTGIVTVFGAHDCLVNVDSSGVYTDGGGNTETWSNGTFTEVPIYYGTEVPPTDFAEVFGEIDLNQSKLFLNLFVAGEFMLKVQDSAGDTVIDELFPYDLGTLIDLELDNGLQMSLGSDYGILGGSFQKQNQDVMHNVSWPAIGAAFPPDPTDPR